MLHNPASSFGSGSITLKDISRLDCASLHSTTAILYNRTKSGYIPLDTMPHAYSPSNTGLEYVPSLDTYIAWQQQLGSTKPQRKIIALPAGFPERYQSKMVWEGSGVQKSKWVVLLSESHLQEIDNTLQFFQGQLPLSSSSSIIITHDCTGFAI